MKTKALLFGGSLLALAALLAQDRIVIEIMKSGGKGAIAVPDFRGSGAAAPLMSAFNQTLWDELDGSGLFRMVPKTSYPLNVPQRPEDWTPDNPQQTAARTDLGRRLATGPGLPSTPVT